MVPPLTREWPTTGRCGGRPRRKDLRRVVRSVRTRSGLGARWCARKSEAGDFPARGSGCGADDPGDAVGGHPAVTSERRRCGDAVTAESRNRAFIAGRPAENDPASAQARRRRRPAGSNPHHGRWALAGERWPGTCAGRAGDGTPVWRGLGASPLSLRLHADCRCGLRVATRWSSSPEQAWTRCPA